LPLLALAGTAGRFINNHPAAFMLLLILPPDIFCYSKLPSFAEMVKLKAISVLRF
jgi:hypothetical protein